MNITGAHPKIRGGVGSPQNIHEASTTKYHSIGTIGDLGERTFAYASFVGSGTLPLGTLCGQAAEVANHISVAYSSGGAIGSDKITVTLGATAATEGQYAGGWIVGIDGTGSGQIRKIKSHPAANASATLEVTVYDPFTVAGAASSEWSLVVSQYASMIQHSGADMLPSGVPAFTVPAGNTNTQYFWLQVAGPALVQSDASTLVQGDIVVPADATADAGQVTILAGTTVAAVLNLVKRRHVGTVISAGDASDLDFHLIHLEMI